jgi:hypothetical protein
MKSCALPSAGVILAHFHKIPNENIFKSGSREGQSSGWPAVIIKRQPPTASLYLDNYNNRY